MNVDDIVAQAVAYKAELEANLQVASPVACEILSACCSTRDGRLLKIAGELGHDTHGLAAELALMAWEVCAHEIGYSPLFPDEGRYYRVCAEAEALLRDGWLPGDET